MYAAKNSVKPRPPQTQTQKSYRCKVCFDFGKSEKEYNSHSTKNIRGEVTCPCLLKTECKYCFKKGHMAKYCTKREKDEKKGLEKMLMPTATKIQPQPSKIENKHTTNAYNLLMDEEDECEDEVRSTSDVKLEVPPFVPPSPEKNSPPPMSRFRKCVIDEKTGKRVVYMLSWTSSAYESDSECEDYEDEKMWFPINF